MNYFVRLSIDLFNEAVFGHLSNFDFSKEVRNLVIMDLVMVIRVGLKCGGTGSIFGGGVGGD